MVEDFLIDPVMGAKVIMGIDLDAFQALRLRTYWWVPNVIDSSGFGTGKSFVFWIFMNLRCVIIGDQWCYAYYQTFEAGKQIFWPYYRQYRHPLFVAQLGRLDEEGESAGKDNTRGPACYIQHFKNESLVAMPAPNWLQEAKGQAGLTFNVAGIDEWTKVETMAKKTNTRAVNAEGQTVGGINQQILGRVRRRSFNQHHLLWGNHRLFMATAESTMHPSYARVRAFQSEINKGNPNYAMISFSFKDFSNLPAPGGKPFKEEVPNWQTITDMKVQLTKTHFLREGLGIWARETKGWYSEEAVERCIELGKQLGTQPEISRNTIQAITNRMLGNPVHLHYFMGVDPAPAQTQKADDGALAILKCQPRPDLGREVTSNPGDWQCEFVWAYRLRNKSARQWSGLIHQKHQQFTLSGICMDPGGGGQWIMQELNKGRQLINGIETECVPICNLEDMTTGNSHLILTMYARKDAGIKFLWPLLRGDDNLMEAMHVEFQQALEHGQVAFPLPFNDRPRVETEPWPEEQQWALKDLDAAGHQLVDVQVATLENGMFALSQNQAKKFSATGKKDLAYACIYAYVRFLIWLKMGELEFNQDGSDAGGFYLAKT